MSKPKSKAEAAGVHTEQSSFFTRCTANNTSFSHSGQQAACWCSIALCTRIVGLQPHVHWSQAAAKDWTHSRKLNVLHQESDLYYDRNTLMWEIMETLNVICQIEIPIPNHVLSWLKPCCSHIYYAACNVIHNMISYDASFNQGQKLSICLFLATVAKTWRKYSDQIH